jgi:hypothetical protein
LPFLLSPSPFALPPLLDKSFPWSTDLLPLTPFLSLEEEVETPFPSCPPPPEITRMTKKKC